MTVRALVILPLLAACGGAPPLPPAPPVPVEGSRQDIRMLTGTWTGEFVESRAGRHGTITLTLEPGRDTAYGRLLIECAPPPGGYTDAVSAAVQAPEGGRHTALRLGRIVLAEGSMAGRVEPYADFELRCPVDT